MTRFSVKKTPILKSLLLIFVMTLSVASLRAQSVIELLGADVIEYDQKFIDAERVKGNVRFKQDNVFMDCDSAYFFRKQNRVEAFGNIYIRQKDTFNLWGDYLEYDGDEKMARVSQNVRLRDQQMQLTTDQVMYNVASKTAYYTTGGHIVNGEDRLYSREGRYYSRSKQFFFKDSVKLTNPEYVMTSDTLQYNTVSKTAYFNGPTYIRSEENTIFCRSGWYNTDRNTSQFSKGVWIEGETNKLVADSMTYDRNAGIGEAFRNITLIDTTEQIKIRGEYGISYRKDELTRITGNPLAVKYMDDDSLFLKADTLVDLTDSLGKRKLKAYYNTAMHKSDMQGVADSLEYSFTDSTIAMFGDPVIWTEQNQVSGDTIYVYRRNGQLDRMDVKKNAFIASEEQPEVYNQIDGTDMVAYFVGNKLNKVDVQGNGESIYYVKEEDSTYTGVNHIVCSDMLIKIDSNKVRDISFYTKPKGGFYPVNQLPPDKQTLPDLNWQADRRPKLEDFLRHREEQEKELPDSVRDLFKEEEGTE